MREIPLKVSRAIICKKARKLRYNNFMGQFCLRGSRTPRRRNLDVKGRDLKIEKGQAGLQ